MVDPAEVPEYNRRCMNAQKLAQACVTVYLGLDATAEEIGLKGYDTFMREDPNNRNQYAASANIEGFVYASLNAFHQTAVNFIGQNAGAQQYKRVVKTLWICLICVAVVGLVLGSLAYCFGPVLLSLYITDSQEAIAYGMLRLSIICLTYCLCGIMDVSTGALRGLGESFIPMLISVLGVCGLRIGWIYTIFQIPRFHTPLCLFISYPVSWTITFLFQMAAFFLVYRKQKDA
jgi:Na+-driven multidrug efflux pump